MRSIVFTSLVVSALVGASLPVLAPTSSASPPDAWAGPIPIIDGWVTISKALGDGDFKFYRRYGFLLNDDSQPIPNLFILHCAKSSSGHYSYLSIVLPKNYPIRSFNRSSWLPDLNVRFIVNGKASLAMRGEYRDGQIDFDYTPQQSAAFLEVVKAKELAIGFGEKGDILKFSSDHKVYNVLHDLVLARKGNESMGQVSWYPEESIESACRLVDASSTDNGVLLPANDRASSVRIPLVNVGGTFVAPVVINDAISLNFVVDSGAADVTIPIDVFSTLIRAGTINESDISGSQTYITATGDKSDSVTFKIRSLRLGSITVHDVSGSVVPAQGTLLLGQSFLRRFKSWSVDNSAHELMLQ